MSSDALACAIEVEVMRRGGYISPIIICARALEIIATGTSVNLAERCRMFKTMCSMR